MVFQNHKSRSFRIRRGLPQGSVLGFVLFSFFMNSLYAFLRSSVSCSFFAENLAIWPFSPSAPAEVGTTHVAFRLECWCEYWCVPLNPRKCEGSFFLVDSHQANLPSPPPLTQLSFPLQSHFNFPGVTFDRTLSFSKHVSLLKAKFFPCLNILRCISASSSCLSFLCKDFLRPLLSYALPGWFPFLSVTNFTKLKRLHQAVSRAASHLPLFLFSSLRHPYLSYESS